MWSYGREFNLIHCFHICLIVEFFFHLVWSWNIIMNGHIIFLLFDSNIWFRIHFFRFDMLLLIGSCLLFMTGERDNSLQSISGWLDKKIIHSRVMWYKFSKKQKDVKLHHWHFTQTYKWKKRKNMQDNVRCLESKLFENYYLDQQLHW